MRIIIPLALPLLALFGCAVFRHEDTNLKDVVHSTPLSADSEKVMVRGNDVPDQVSLRQLALLKIAQDCLDHGFLTFAFMSVGEPKPHLPNQPPDAPVKMASVRSFVPPTSVVPDIEAGTVVTVKFYKEGDPQGTNSIFAELIVANLASVLQQQ